MEQLWYTWSSKAGKGSSQGFGIQASSMESLSAQQLDIIQQYAYYYLPAGMKDRESSVPQAPHSLVFTNTSIGLLLVHKVYVGLDDYKRPGVFFCHCLFHLPDSFSARMAIDLWGSPFWQPNETYKVVENLSHVTEEDLQLGSSRVLQNNTRTEDLAFLIEAFLCIDKENKIYIVAPAIQVASLIWGLAHSIPRSFLPHLTFSTYEQDVHYASVKVVGTISSEKDDPLSEECYTTFGVALNCITGRRSLLPDHSRGKTIAAYARFVSSCLMHGQQEKLETFFALLEDRKKTVLVLYEELYGSATLSESVLIRLLYYPFARIFLLEDKVYPALVSFISVQTDWLRTDGITVFAELLAKSRQDKVMEMQLGSFIKRMAADIYVAFFEHEWKRWDPLVALLGTCAPVAAIPEPWLELFDRFNDFLMHYSKNMEQFFSDLGWQRRQVLLEKWAQIEQEHIIAADLVFWLNCSWSEIKKLFALNIPDPWRRETLLRKNQVVPVEEEPSSWLLLAYDLSLQIPVDTGISTYNWELQETFLQILASAANILFQGQSVASSLLNGLAKKPSFVAAWLHYPWKRMSNFPLLVKLLPLLYEAGTLDEWLLAASLTPNENVDLFREHNQLLLSAQGFSPAIIEIFLTYMHMITYENYEQETDSIQAIYTSMLRVYEKGYRGQEGGELASYIEAWRLIIETSQETLSQLRKEEVYLQRLRDAIVKLRMFLNKQYRSILLRLVVASVHNVDDLALYIPYLAPAQLTEGETSNATLFHALLPEVQERYHQTQTLTELEPYIVYACEQTISLLDQTESVGEIIDSYVENFKADQFDQKDVVAILSLLYERRKELSKKSKRRIQVWSLVYKSSLEPGPHLLDQTNLANLGKAIQELGMQSHMRYREALLSNISFSLRQVLQGPQLGLEQSMELINHTCEQVALLVGEKQVEEIFWYMASCASLEQRTLYNHAAIEYSYTACPPEVLQAILRNSGNVYKIS